MSTLIDALLTCRDKQFIDTSKSNNKAWVHIKDDFKHKIDNASSSQTSK